MYGNDFRKMKKDIIGMALAIRKRVKQLKMFTVKQIIFATHIQPWAWRRRAKAMFHSRLLFCDGASGEI